MTPCTRQPQHTADASRCEGGTWHRSHAPAAAMLLTGSLPTNSPNANDTMTDVPHLRQRGGAGNTAGGAGSSSLPSVLDDENASGGYSFSGKGSLFPGLRQRYTHACKASWHKRCMHGLPGLPKVLRSTPQALRRPMQRAHRMPVSPPHLSCTCVTMRRPVPGTSLRAMSCR
jgi:hypothetical protein